MKTRWIEFFITSAIYLFFVIFIERHTSHQPSLQFPFQAHLFTIFSTISLYILFIYPIFFSKRKMYLWLLTTVLLFTLQSTALFTIQQQQWINLYNTSTPFILSGATFLCLLLYTAIKIIGKKILHVYQQETPYSKPLMGFILSYGIGLVVFTPIFFVHESLAVLTGMAIPLCYTIFATHYYFILPNVEKNNIPIAVRIAASIIVSIICVILFLSIAELTLNFFSSKFYTVFTEHNILLYVVFSAVIVPSVYIFYNYEQQRQKQILGLQKELGKTEADLRFLHSQINPHFIFNAMNTLYGIALREQAERTSTGIQKLSEMMRFMLHENHHEHIPLSRESTYITQYIDIQKLRIADISSIQITTDLPEGLSDEKQIAPMLLIPFIENAFKHGISLNHPSWINIQLILDQDILKLTVRNSVHETSANQDDPERDHSGIGLENVKSRLQILYPNSHQLHMEINNKEFFVFLHIHLSHL